MPAPVLHGVVEAFARSLDTVFLWAVPVVALSFLASWLLREIPLREHAHVGARTAQPSTVPVATDPDEGP